ncbi:MAG: hypothetical protein F4Z81_10665 [Gemmatimonadetes bacterium]|nr:hypothetical protein [Gemmatimonadota bacterium]MYB62240.1 hypothetical protein [Gemmatimonadota bacterium]
MKSALEIAMEKTAGAQQGGKLTDEQRKGIADLEKEYQAKIAEQEIMVESKIKALAAQAQGHEFQQQVHALREQLVQERERLESEKNAKIQAVRDRRS